MTERNNPGIFVALCMDYSKAMRRSTNEIPDPGQLEKAFQGNAGISVMAGWEHSGKFFHTVGRLMEFTIFTEEGQPEEKPGVPGIIIADNPKPAPPGQEIIQTYSHIPIEYLRSLRLARPLRLRHN